MKFEIKHYQFLDSHPATSSGKPLSLECGGLRPAGFSTTNQIAIGKSVTQLYPIKGLCSGRNVQRIHSPLPPFCSSTYSAAPLFPRSSSSSRTCLDHLFSFSIDSLSTCHLLSISLTWKISLLSECYTSSYAGQSHVSPSCQTRREPNNSDIINPAGNGLVNMLLDALTH